MDASEPLPRPTAVPPRIEAERVHLSPAPVVLGGGGEDAPISVVPILDGEIVRFLEIRCPCGRSLRVECVYGESPTTATAGTPPPVEAPRQEAPSR